MSSCYHCGCRDQGPGSVPLLYPGPPPQSHQAGEEEGVAAPDQVVEQAGQEVEAQAEAENDENQLRVTVC